MRSARRTGNVGGIAKSEFIKSEFIAVDAARTDVPPPSGGN
jgi:hypothetical protein